MAGRGRGGRGGTLTHEQLQGFTQSGMDMPQVQTAPPPTFPPLNSKPVNVETTTGQKYQVLWVSHFLNHMRETQGNTSQKNRKQNKVPRKKTGWEAMVVPKMKAKVEFNWAYMPAELQLSIGKRSKKAADSKAKVAAKKLKIDNIQVHFNQLEEKERVEERQVGQEKKNSDSEEEEAEVEAADDEMDDENDYGNSYFDNGEAYNEEDDNLDDGPVY